MTPEDRARVADVIGRLTGLTPLAGERVLESLARLGYVVVKAATVACGREDEDRALAGAGDSDDLRPAALRAAYREGDL